MTNANVKNILQNEKEIIIFGCGGHSRSIIDSLHGIDENIEILLVDENAVVGETILGYKVEREYRLKKDDNYIIAIGDNIKRGKLYEQLQKEQMGCCVSVISKHSYLGLNVEVGKGTFVARYAYIGPQAKIGDNVIINTSSVIEHEVIIGNSSHIAPQTTICGRVKIGNAVFCGAGSVIIDKVHVCDNVIIGAGAVVTEDILNPGTYIGVPAKKLNA